MVATWDCTAFARGHLGETRILTLIATSVTGFSVVFGNLRTMDCIRDAIGDYICSCYGLVPMFIACKQ